jgi:hypothetical protein
MSPFLHLLGRLAHLAFWYCCDFMVNLANLTRTSYYEAVGAAYWGAGSAVVSAAAAAQSRVGSGFPIE